MFGRVKLNISVWIVVLAALSGVQGEAQVNLQIFNTPSPHEIQTNRNAQLSDPASQGNGILVSGALIANSPLTATRLTVTFPAAITSGPSALDGTFGGTPNPVPSADPIRISGATGLFQTAAIASVDYQGGQVMITLPGSQVNTSSGTFRLTGVRIDVNGKSAPLNAAASLSSSANNYILQTTSIPLITALGPALTLTQTAFSGPDQGTLLILTSQSGGTFADPSASVVIGEGFASAWRTPLQSGSTGSAPNGSQIRLTMNGLPAGVTANLSTVLTGSLAVTMSSSALTSVANTTVLSFNNATLSQVESIQLNVTLSGTPTGLNPGTITLTGTAVPIGSALSGGVATEAGGFPRFAQADIGPLLIGTIGSGPPSTQFNKISGDNQIGNNGATLAAPLIVEVRDSLNNPVAGVNVAFSALSGGGFVSASNVATGADGRAQTFATLGLPLGTQTFRASVSGLGNIDFSATATQSAAVSIVKVSAHLDAVVRSTQLLTVLASDVRGNLVAGVTVLFSASSGGASAVPGSVVTGSNGQASAILTLSQTAGPNTYTATASGLAGSPITVTINGFAGPATQLVKVSGDNQTGSAGLSLAQPLVVEARDQFSNPKSGVSVTFTPGSGSGTVNPTGPQNTDVSGRAQVSVILGTAGVKFFTASTAGVTSVVFSATALTTLAPVINAPTATPPGLNPNIAPLYGGPFSLSVRGQNFVNGGLISVGQSTFSENFAADTQISATVLTSALNTAGTANVKVTNPDTQVSNTASLKVVVRGDTNANGVVNIGDALLCALTVGGLSTPPLPISVGDANLDGNVNIGDCLVIALFSGRVLMNFTGPVITSTSPPLVTRGGTLTINGSGFSPIPANQQIMFSTVGGSSTRVTPSAATLSSLTVTVPTDAISGALQVYRVDAPMGGSEFPLSVDLTATPLALNSISPSANVARGSSVVLRGLGFDSNPLNNVVAFRTAAGTSNSIVTAAAPTSLTVTVPNDAVCGPVAVTAGAFTSESRIVAVQGAPCSLQLTDIYGNAYPGETLVLEGAGFDVSTPGNNVVTFAGSGGSAVATVVQAGGTQLQVHVPETAVSGNVVVSVAGTSSNVVSYSLPSATSVAFVDVVINSPDAVGAYQVSIQYNKNVVQLTNANITGGNGAGFTDRPATVNIDNALGVAIINSFQTSNAPTGSFTVARLQFSPVGLGTSPLTLSGVALTDTLSSDLPVDRVSLSSYSVTVFRVP